MRRRLLIITKEPEFDSHGEVVLGQCEPFTSGWQLLLVHLNRQQELLLAGTYTDLRKIQEICVNIEEPAKIKQRVEELKSLLLNSNTTDTIRVQMSGSDSSDATKEMQAINITTLPRTSPCGFLSLESIANGVLLVLLVQPEKAGDAAYIRDELTFLEDFHLRAVVIDLSRLATAPRGLISEVTASRARLLANGGELALCNVSSDSRHSFKNFKGGAERVPIYETSADAVAALI